MPSEFSPSVPQAMRWLAAVAGGTRRPPTTSEAAIRAAMKAAKSARAIASRYSSLALDARERRRTRRGTAVPVPPWTIAPVKGRHSQKSSLSTPEPSPSTPDLATETEARQASLTRTVGTPPGETADAVKTPWWKRLLGLH